MTPGTRLGPYEVIAAIGEGGMGQVYRASDTRLDRDVAIKVIPESLARDPDRVARFEREAKAIAALSHPNILAVFDTGVDAGTHFVVTELLSGETLRDRVAKGPMPAQKAVEIAALIANGLAAAHDKGLVHRDLKPENVFLTADGQVKILDFGLARSVAEGGHGSETRAAITDAGTVLGTVGYMAPEQVRGQTADARADLFALGAVLHEMLSGARAFSRPTAAETMTAILNEDPPDLPASRPDVSPALGRIVRHCLEKQPAERFQTARDVAFALNALSGSGSGAVARAAVEPRPSQVGRERLAWALATLSLAGVAIWLAADRTAPAPAPDAARAVLLLPEGTRLPSGAPSRRFAISPDGRTLAFVAERGGERSLWVHTLSEPAARLVAGTAGASGPIWMADSRRLTFIQNREIRLLDTEAGRPVAMPDVAGAAAWGPDGERLVVTNTAESAELSVVDQDGNVQTILKERLPAGQRIGFPAFLPGGRQILYALSGFPNPSTAGFFVVDRSGGPPIRLTAAAADAEQFNAAVASGYLLNVREGMIIARRLMPDPVALDSQVLTVGGPVDIGGAAAALSASQAGVLVYQPRSTSDYSRLFWFDRSGARVSKVGDDAAYTSLELSPDETRLLVGIADPATRLRDIWTIDLARGVPTRLTFGAADERSAVWSLDSSSIVYRGQGGQLYSHPLGAGADAPFLVDGASKDPAGWSPDGRFFVYRVSGGETGNDIWVKRADSDDPPAPLLASPFNENYAEWSPDGHLLAYASSDSGADEVYIMRFPPAGSRERVSIDGGSFPRWRGDGREIFYLDPGGRMMAAPVQATDTAITVGAAEALFETDVVTDPGTPFVVSRDGQRFLINTAVPSSAPPALHVVFNWPSLVNRRR